MSILDKLFPRRARSAAPLASGEIAVEIEARKAARSAAQARIAAAASNRAAACEALDAPGIVAAEADAVLARAEVEVADHAIRELQTAHAEALQVEQREAFHVDVAAATHQGEAVEARLMAEYDAAAAALASILADLSDYYDSATALRHRARELGETIDLPAPQACRAAPPRWRASWPNPEGAHLGRVQGPPEDAPRGSVRWVDGEPVPLREGVTVERRPVEGLDSILDVIRQLPPLRYGEAAHWPRPVPVERVVLGGYVDRTRPRKHAPIPALVPSPHDDPRRDRER